MSGSARNCLLFDKPEAQDEQFSALLDSPSSTRTLLARLEDKLGLAGRVHHSFGVKCYPKYPVAPHSIRACAKNLASEINFSSPRLIVVFGAQALRSVEILLGAPFLDPLSCGLLGEFQFSVGRIKLFAAPSLEELESHPHWRGPFFDQLKAVLQAESLI